MADLPFSIKLEVWPPNATPTLQVRITITDKSGPVSTTLPDGTDLSSPQPAKIFIIAGRNGAGATLMGMGCVSGTLAVVNGNPQFALTKDSFTGGDPTSDAALVLDFNRDMFTGVDTLYPPPVFRLPRVVPGGLFHENYQLYTILTVGDKNAWGTAEGAYDSVFDVPVLYSNVPRSAGGEDSTDTMTCYGVTNIYPFDNMHFPTANVPRFPGVLNVYLHKSMFDALKSKMQSMNPNAAWQALASRINNTFYEVGFPRIVVNDSSPDPLHVDQAFVSKYYVPLNDKNEPNGFPPYVAKTATQYFDASGKLTTDADKIPIANFQSVPFFDFYVFAQQPPQDGGECANAEFSLFDGTFTDGQGNKRVVAPVVYVWPPQDEQNNDGSTPLFQACKTDDDRLNFLAHMVCHEIAHTFGLRHELHYDPNGVDANGKPFPYVLVSGSGAFKFHNRGIMGCAEVEDDGSYPFRHFGPVHRAAIQQLFGLQGGNG
jgi:hypothetical protein